MERARQMRRDLIAVAVVVVLLVGLLLLLSSGAAFAQSAAEDQYSSSSGAITFPPSTFGQANPFPEDDTTTIPPSTFGTPSPFPNDSGATTFEPDPFGAGPSVTNEPAINAAGHNLPSGGFPPNLGVGGGGVSTPAPPIGLFW